MFTFLFPIVRHISFQSFILQDRSRSRSPRQRGRDGGREPSRSQGWLGSVASNLTSSKTINQDDANGNFANFNSK